MFVYNSTFMNNLGKVLSSVLSGRVASNKQRRANKRRPGLARTRYPQRRRVRSDTRGWSRALPASYASHVKAAFRMSRVGDGVRVSGCDLVTPLPSVIETVSGASEYLFSVITANPLYWTGTRIAQVGAAYMNYRPLSLIFRYIPQVAVTQPGTVIMGTLWNGAAPSADLQQTLLTSNGGCMINCYVPGNTRVKLGTNLQQNLFTCAGDINPDTSPFIFVATTRGCLSTGISSEQVVPGYFYVEYEYEFKNPIGQSWMYTRSAPVEFGDASYSLPNRSIVLLQQAAGFGPGTVLDVEGDGRVYYHGTQVTIPDSTLIQVYENGQNTALASLSGSYVLYGSNSQSGPWVVLPWEYSGTTSRSTIVFTKGTGVYTMSEEETVELTTKSPGFVLINAGLTDENLWLKTEAGVVFQFQNDTETIYRPPPENF